VVNLRHGLESPAHVVSLNSIAALRRTRRDPSGALGLGALTRLDELIANAAVRREFPVLARAASTVSGPTLRGMGTLGGNICLDTRCHWYNQSVFWRGACGFCLKKDGTACHVAPGSQTCWAVYSGDLAPALLTLEAGIVLRSARGERALPLSEFFLEDGAKRFALEPDEVLTEVVLPPHRASLGGYYGKLRSRASIDYPLAGVAIAGRVAPDRTFRDVLAALTAVAPRPYLVPGLAARIEGLRVDDGERLRGLVELVLQSASPLYTGGAFGPGYRRLRVGLFARDGLATLARSCSAETDGEFKRDRRTTRPR
jgi:4-hydroxybenzoyl-CoA reductase subunit beta